MNKTSEKFCVAFVYLALAITTLAVFWQVHNFEFINCDDGEYVCKNNHISAGLTREGIAWVFTHEHGGNWHPLTGLSHMLDCSLFDLNAGRHHLVNVFFHVVNALLLFTVFRRMTGALWPSAFVAAAFALHPLHIESVAWISERKDVLSALFWILTMAAYFRYVKNPAIGRYALTLVLFALGLMAKPMLVTLPFTLLLLDYWPLNRLEGKGQFYKLVLEKIPFFVLAAASSVVTLLVQTGAGAVWQTEVLPMKIRAANAVVSYIRYIGKLFVPLNLAAFYPHPVDKIPVWQILAAVALLLVITICVIRLGKKYGYLPTGWFWYLGTLIPVIGLVQVGDQAMADRYTYIPLLGLFLIIAWGLKDLSVAWPHRKAILASAASAVLIVLLVLTGFQLRFWQNSLAIWQRTLQVTKDNAAAHYSFADALAAKGRFDEAAEHYLTALQIMRHPHPEILCNLGRAYYNLGHYNDAVDALNQAIKAKPDNAQAFNLLGVAFNRLGFYQKSLWAFKQAVQIKPDFADAHYNLGLFYINSGDKNSAFVEYEILKKLDAEKANTLLSLMQK